MRRARCSGTATSASRSPRTLAERGREQQRERAPERCARRGTSMRAGSGRAAAHTRTARRTASTSQVACARGQWRDGLREAAAARRGSATRANCAAQTAQKPPCRRPAAAGQLSTKSLLKQPVNHGSPVRLTASPRFVMLHRRATSACESDRRMSALEKETALGARITAEPRSDWTRVGSRGAVRAAVQRSVVLGAVGAPADFDPNAVQVSTLLSIKTGACPEDCAYCPQSIRFDDGRRARTT